MAINYHCHGYQLSLQWLLFIFAIMDISYLCHGYYFISIYHYFTIFTDSQSLLLLQLITDFLERQKRKNLTNIYHIINIFIHIAIVITILIITISITVSNYYCISSNYYCISSNYYCISSNYYCISSTNYQYGISSNYSYCISLVAVILVTPTTWGIF